MTLKQYLTNWTTLDKAKFLLGAVLGLWTSDAVGESNEESTIWDAPTGELLGDVIDRLTALEYLEFKSEGQTQYVRWVSS